MHTFETPAPVELRLEVSRGRVSIAAEDAVQTTVEVRPLHDDAESRALFEGTEVRQDGDRISIISPRGERIFPWRSGAIEVVVRLPKASRADLRLDSARLESIGELGAVRLKSGSGEARLDICASLEAMLGSGALRAAQVNGACDVKTGSGRIEVGQATGETRVTTGSGAVRVDHAKGALTVMAASGSTEVGEAEGGADLHSASGRIVVDRVGQGRLRARTASGAVDIGVVGGAAAWLDVSSVSGRVESDLEGSEPPEDGAPKVELKINTVSGRIRLRRAAPTHSQAA
jgi:hypothetical protein